MFRENSPRKKRGERSQEFDCGFRNLSWTCYLVFKDQSGAKLLPAIHLRPEGGGALYVTPLGPVKEARPPWLPQPFRFAA